MIFTHLAVLDMTHASHCAEWLFWTKAGPCNFIFSLCWQLSGNSEFMIGPERIHLRLRVSCGLHSCCSEQANPQGLP